VAHGYVADHIHEEKTLSYYRESFRPKIMAISGSGKSLVPHCGKTRVFQHQNSSLQGFSRIYSIPYFSIKIKFLRKRLPATAKTTPAKAKMFGNDLFRLGNPAMAS